MTNRVLLGKKGIDYGLWVSKPGVDVTTATDDEDFLIAPNLLALQVILSGKTTWPGAGGTRTITVPNLGFYPMIMANTQRSYVLTEWLSSTSFRLEVGPDYGLGVVSNNLYWYLVNIPGFDP